MTDNDKLFLLTKIKKGQRRKKIMTVLFIDRYSGEILLDYHTKSFNNVDVDGIIDTFSSRLKGYCKNNGVIINDKFIKNPVIQVFFDDIKIPFEPEFF